MSPPPINDCPVGCVSVNARQRRQLLFDLRADPLERSPIASADLLAEWSRRLDRHRQP